MNIKQRLREIAEDLQVIADDHPANWPPVILEVEARPDGSIVCKQLGDGTAETIAPNCSFGSENFRVRNITPGPEPQCPSGYFDADDATKANISEIDPELLDAAETIKRAFLVEGRYPKYHRSQVERLRREWRLLSNAIEKLILALQVRKEIAKANEIKSPVSLFDTPSAVSLIDAEGTEVAREPINWPTSGARRILDDIDLDEALEVRSDPRFRFARNSAGGETVYFVGEGQRPDVWKWPGKPEVTEFRYCPNCKLWFAGPAKIDTKNTFCGAGCQNEFFIKAKDIEPETAAAILRPASEPEPNPFTQIAEDHKANHEKRFGAIETPASNDSEGVAKCSNCGKPFLALDGFKWTKGGEDARPICSVNCLASAAGLLPNE